MLRHLFAGAPRSGTVGDTDRTAEGHEAGAASASGCYTIRGTTLAERGVVSVAGEDGKRTASMAGQEGSRESRERRPGA
jgi:hypothetical protein